MDYVSNTASFSDYAFGLNLKEIKHYFRCLLKSLDAVHTNMGYVHRDIKPSNILFNPQNGKFRLIDFGLAQTITHLKTRNMKDDQKLENLFQSCM